MQCRTGQKCSYGLGGTFYWSLVEIMFELGSIFGAWRRACASNTWKCTYSFCISTFLGILL